MRRRVQRGSLSYSRRSIATIFAWSGRSLEAGPHYRAGASAPRNVCNSSEPGVSDRLPGRRRLGAAACRREGRSRRQRTDGVVRAFRRSRIRSPHRLREPRKCASGPLIRAAARDCDSTGPGRRTHAPDQPTAHRERLAFVHFRPGGAVYRRLVQGLDPETGSGESSASQRRSISAEASCFSHSVCR